MSRVIYAATSVILLAVVGIIGAVVPARATIIKNYEFNIDGILPSAEPDITLANNTGNPENAIFSVSDGLLKQRTFAVNGNASYSYPNIALGGGSLDSSQSLSMEARVRILQIEGSTGAFFQVLDGTSRYRFAFTETGVELLSNGGFHQIDLDTSVFHTYRLDSGGGTSAFDFYVDNVLTYSGNAFPAGGLNGFNFGDGITESGAGADADWDFVRLSQPAAEASIPEPGMVIIMGFGLAYLGLTRRKRGT